MDYYNVSLHAFFYFFYESSFFFPKWSLSILFRSFSLKHCGLLQCFPTWFLFCYSVFPHVFFQNYLYWIFFNIELVENSALTFPTCFFFIFLFAFFFQNCLLLLLFSIFCVFFRIVFVDFIFLIWSWLKI